MQITYVKKESELEIFTFHMNVKKKHCIKNKSIIYEKLNVPLPSRLLSFLNTFQ